jgi:hypothetical protein
MPVQGLHLITPTSIVSSGSGNSSSIGANGAVTFSSCVELSLNGVFSSTYDNYQIVIRMSQSSAATDPLFYYRANGTDDATFNSYTYQELTATGTSVSGYRGTASFGFLIDSNNTLRGGAVMFVYGPYLTQPTVSRSLGVGTTSSAVAHDVANSHSQSTAYDGITFRAQTGNISGLLTVYGMRK